MKIKKTSLFTVMVSIIMIAILTTACATSTPAAQTEPEAESAAPETDVIVPLYPLENAQDALADGGYSVAFTADDLAQTDAGYELTVEVYDYDRYEIEAIDKLTTGSQIQFCNKIVTIEDVEKNAETGFVIINGGVENDGIELKEEDGLYRTVTMNDYPVYYSVGKVTIPLAKDVTFEDQASSENGPDSEGEIAQADAVPEMIEKIDIPFNCTNTVITVRGEQILQIIRYWTP